jgi:hypothetical protein
VATRAGSGLPRAEVLLFRAEAEDEEHRASVGRRAVRPVVSAPPPAAGEGRRGVLVRSGGWDGPALPASCPTNGATRAPTIRSRCGRVGRSRPGRCAGG